jgi:hypothetical protein
MATDPATKPAAPRKEKTVTAAPPRKGFRSPFRGMLRKRRSRSAPPAPTRKPLIEEHFRIDSREKLVLPGVLKHGEDLARDAHDFFNLIILIPIVALNVMNWNWDKIFNWSFKSGLDAWTGEWFEAFFFAVVGYFFIDLCWVLVIPNCVKSPSTIIQHHLITMLYILIPYFRPKYQWAMGACMSVEINTWFLIARRVFNKQGFSPWIIDLSFMSIRVKIISVCFYVTWIGIRCILYPILLVWLVKVWLATSLKVGTNINLDMIAPLMHSSFCVLNFRWTYDLIMSKIRYYKRRSMNKDYRQVVDKGL